MDSGFVRSLRARHCIEEGRLATKDSTMFVSVDAWIPRMNASYSGLFVTLSQKSAVTSVSFFSICPRFMGGAVTDQEAA